MPNHNIFLAVCLAVIGIFIAGNIVAPHPAEPRPSYHFEFPYN